MDVYAMQKVNKLFCCVFFIIASVVIKKLLNDLKWTWVTSLRKTPSDEKYYSVFIEDNDGELIYPFNYYPQSDAIQFYGYENVMSINSSKTLKKLLISEEVAG